MPRWKAFFLCGPLALIEQIGCGGGDTSSSSASMTDAGTGGTLGAGGTDTGGSPNPSGSGGSGEHDGASATNDASTENGGSSAGAPGQDASAIVDVVSARDACFTGCTVTRSIQPCRAGEEAWHSVWLCSGPSVDAARYLLDAGCVDLATSLPRYCCPDTLLSTCQ
jgi:hypothetical protein